MFTFTVNLYLKISFLDFLIKFNPLCLEFFQLFFRLFEVEVCRRFFIFIVIFEEATLLGILTQEALQQADMTVIFVPELYSFVKIKITLFINHMDLLSLINSANQ